MNGFHEQYLKHIAKPPTRHQLKQALKAKLRWFMPGTSASTRYTTLKDAKEFALSHSLEWAEEYQCHFVRAAQELLDAYVDYAMPINNHPLSRPVSRQSVIIQCSPVESSKVVAKAAGKPSARASKVRQDTLF